jgi:RimJ/RimL family protein N-acetyltransferase
MDTKYPKTVRLADGAEIQLRPLEKKDFDGLLAFFRGLSEEDRLFLTDDVTKEEAVREIFEETDGEYVQRVLAFAGTRVVGDAIFRRPRSGWSRHVAEVRCIIGHDHQGQGLGSALLREVVDHALARGIDKVVAYLPSNQTAGQRIFEKLGFRREAVLRDHMMDTKGRKHHLVIMTNDVAELWQKMQDLIDEADFRGEA